MFADDEARKDYEAEFLANETILHEQGFTQVGDSNAWEKDGVRITIQQIMHEGLDNVLQKHSEVVRTLPATPGS